MNKKVLLILPAVALIAAGCGKTTSTTTNTTPTPTPTVTASVTPTSTPSSASGGSVPTATPSTTSNVVNVTVVGTNFGFDPGTIRVKKGNTVRVTFQNKTGTHDWVVDEFAGAKTKIIQGGETDVVEFVANKTGTFEYYCSVGSHRQMGMKGKLIVE